MRKSLRLLATLLFVSLLASTVSAIQTCPQGITSIYQYSVATSPGGHQSHFSSVVAAANQYCGNRYGSNPNYLGVRITLNSTCTAFKIYCEICGNGRLNGALQPMGLTDAVSIAEGATGAGGGVLVSVDQTVLDRFDSLVPGFLVEYVNSDNSTGLAVTINAETGEAEVNEPRALPAPPEPTGRGE